MLYLARLFEVESGNLAYNFAIKHYKDQIGEKVYEYSIIIPVKVMVAHELLKEWGFGDYAPVLIDNKGYDDVEYWKILTFAELKGMNFKDGHARKFMDKARNL